jgi:putative N-acetylmannosamine-6-phosphate epimerase
MLDRGIIVSVQGYTKETIEELVREAISAGAVAIRTDKRIHVDINKKVPIIGLWKTKVNDPVKEAYITPTRTEIERVVQWADYVAVDYRELNTNLPDISKYCREKKLKVVADISTIRDYENIKENDYYYTYIATTLSVFSNLYDPDFKILHELIDAGEKNIIAEGNFKIRNDVSKAYKMGIKNICIGAAISNVYKLTQKFTSIQ